MENIVIERLLKVLKGKVSVQEVENLLEKPKYEYLGDIAFPCFMLAKQFRKSPHLIAEEITQQIDKKDFEKIEVQGGYINFFYDKESYAKSVISTILKEREKYGSKRSTGQQIVIDYSSPNIAKPFSMGHLRSTVIGQALANIAEKNGDKTVRINHLGDWGTQFGKLIVAYKKWGLKERVEASPIEELLKLYVKFHEVADESLNNEARVAFKMLENGDSEALQLWRWFREESIKEFMALYDLLNIHFDSLAGESFYNDKMQQVVEELEGKRLLVESEGADVVELENMPPCLIKKKDGATLYATRDLATAFYRMIKYQPKAIYYVVGNEQSLHFKQWIQVVEKMGYEWSKNLHHVPFGMMLKDGKKMATRKGKIVLLANVLEEAIDTVKQNIEEKNPTLENKEAVAKAVGVGAVIFHDLKNFRLNDIEFSLQEMLNFEGETGPYVQYTFARIQSILEKQPMEKNISYKLEINDYEWTVYTQLVEFPAVIERAYELTDPSIVAKYVLKLARVFNKYYGHTKILEPDDFLNGRLALCECVAIVLKESTRLLGIETPKSM
ncbi:arginine--tRNA ligase [Rummeliibacillus suwonensis]|uniref:arginine--tRNA ligase n=1 Tax=Rummeliibacillus suwonensis TaxID=1306154 RepID=UPI00289E4E57|nr:arginine--tRNA ligase [Rummeliibacillus suwonensis]